MGYLSPVNLEKLPYVSQDSTEQDIGQRVEDSRNDKPTTGGFLMKVLDLLQRGNYASANVALDMVNKGGFNPFKSSWEGITGKSKTLYSDVLDEVGVKNKWVKGGLGFTLDVALDPTTYLGIGAAGKLGGKLLSKAGVNTLKKATTQYGAKTAAEMMTKMIATAEGASKYTTKAGLKFAGKELISGETFGKFSKVVGLDKAAGFVKNTKAGQWVGNAFIPNFRPAGITDNDWNVLQEARKTFETVTRKNQLEVFDNVFRLSRKYTTKDRQLISEAITKAKGGDLKSFMKGSSDELVGEAENIRSQFSRFWTEENKRGLIEGWRAGYLPGLYKQNDGVFTRFSRPRVFDSPEEAAKAGFRPIADNDIAALYGVRGISSARYTATADFYGRMKGLGTYIDPKEVTGKKIAGMQTTKSQFLQGYWFDKETAKEINKFSSKFTDEGVRDFTKFYDKALNLWKGSVTTLFPAFHTRNAISNFWLMHLAGVTNPGVLSEAMGAQRLAHAMKLGDKAAVEKLANKKIGGYTLREIVDQARLTGVMDAGWYGLEISGEDIAGRAMNYIGVKSAPKNVLTKVLHPIKTGREAGTIVENNARLGVFIDQLKKGNTIDGAAEWSKKHLFDYGELTSWEKNQMRRVVPFYTWLRKNVPIELEGLVKQPGKFAAMEHMREEVGAMSSAPNEESLPEFIKEQYSIRLPFQRGKKNLYISPDLAFQDLAIFTNLSDQIGSISPFIKAPFEYAANYDFFRRRELSDPDLPASTKAWDKAVKLVFNNLRIAGVMNRLTDDQKSTLNKIVREVAGQYIYQYSPSESRKWLNYRTKMEKTATKKRKKKTFSEKYLK
jgi:hypothetical protein